MSVVSVVSVIPVVPPKGPSKMDVALVIALKLIVADTKSIA